MASEKNHEKINEELTALANKENEISQKVQTYHRNLLKPLWDERRKIVKQIPNFWSEVVSYNIKCLPYIHIYLLLLLLLYTSLVILLSFLTLVNMT